MENAVSHRLEGFPVQIDQILVAARQHGDLAAIGKVNAARHRQFKHPHARLFGNLAQRQNIVAPEGRHLDPACAVFHCRKDLPQDPLGHCRRRQAGDDVIDARRHLFSAVGPDRARRDKWLGERFLEVGDSDLEARLQKAARTGRAKIAEADVSVVHENPLRFFTTLCGKPNRRCQSAAGNRQSATFCALRRGSGRRGRPHWFLWRRWSEDRRPAPARRCCCYRREAPRDRPR